MLFGWMVLGQAVASPCVTLSHAWPSVGTAPLPSPPPGDAKTNRDAYGTFQNEFPSENFVVKWGPEGDVMVADVEALSAALEFSWNAQIGEMAYPAPYGTEAYRMNVYIGSTGGGGPDAYAAYAYASVDSDGYPMLVYSTERVAYVEKSISSAAHEFFHTIQMTVGAYPDEAGDWYWEATATWMAEELFPEVFLDGYLYGLASYAFLPHLSLNHYEMPQAEWKLVQGHQYGAFIFVRYLTKHLERPNLVRDSFLDAGDQRDPLRVIADLLAADGDAIDEHFALFGAHTAVLDYDNGEAYSEALETMAAWYAAEDQRVAAQIPSTGIPWTAAPDGTLPRHDGYNVLEVSPPPSGHWNLEIDDQGVEGAALTGVLVRPNGDGWSYSAFEEMLPVEGADDAAWWLVVAVWSDEPVDGQSYAYSYRLEEAPASAPDPVVEAMPPSRRCQTGPVPAWWFLAGLVPVFRRRRPGEQQAGRYR